MAGEFPGLPNFGYGLQVPAEAILQMLPFTPQYKEAQQARLLNEQKLKQLEQIMYQSAALHPEELKLLQSQIGAQGAATEASKAQASRTRAETPTGMDRMIGRGGILAEIANRLAQSGYYKTLGKAQESEQLNSLLQTLPMFDEVEEDVEVPGWFGNKVTKQKRQVPGAQRSAVLQKLLQKSGVPFTPTPMPPPGAGAQPGMAEVVYGTMPGGKPQVPQAQPQAQPEQTSTLQQLPNAILEQLGIADASQVVPAMENIAAQQGAAMRGTPQIPSGVLNAASTAGIGGLLWLLSKGRSGSAPQVSNTGTWQGWQSMANVPVAKAAIPRGPSMSQVGGVPAKGVKGGRSSGVPSMGNVPVPGTSLMPVGTEGLDNNSLAAILRRMIPPEILANINANNQQQGLRQY